MNFVELKINYNMKAKTQIKIGIFICAYFIIRTLINI